MRFWCKFGATFYRAILTIFTISNSVLKTPRDNFDRRSKSAKMLRICGAFLLSLGRTEVQMKHTYRCMKNEVATALL